MIPQITILRCMESYMYVAHEQARLSRLSTRYFPPFRLAIKVRIQRRDRPRLPMNRP